MGHMENMKSKFEQMVEDANKDNFAGGVYIAVDVYHDNDTLQHIQDRMREMLSVGMDLYGLHTTIIYSKKPAVNLNVSDLKLNAKKFFIATIKEITTWVDNKNVRYLGILLVSPDLVSENKRLMGFGFVSDFDSYMPHITLAYNTSIDHTDEDYVEIFEELNKMFANRADCVLQLTNEHIEPLDVDWTK